MPLSASFLLMVLGVRHLVLFPHLRDLDEGLEAHLFQLIMPLQALIILAFALTWLLKRPKAAVAVIGLQVAAAAAVLAIVYTIEHT